MIRTLEKYELLEEIGHGGMATVYRARDTNLDRMVALKLMHPHLRGAKEARARFRREAQSVARLRHPAILEIYDYSGEGSDESYISAELLTGPTLKLYVEQAVASQAEKPYRQRVYHLVALPDGTYRSDVYTLPGDPLAHAGAWRKAPILGGLAPKDLEPRAGCSITLRATDARTFLGSTHERDCPSERQGAVYATSEVAITEYGLTSWDRGFDAEGRHVWGAEKGPYCFDKVAQDPPQ